MDKVVYFLGAGFSAPLGLPVMSNFLLKSKDLYFSDPSRYEHFQDVFKTIDRLAVSKNYYNTDLFNVEEILSILEMREFVGEERIRKSFVKYITDVINSYTPTFRSYADQIGAVLPANWQGFIFGDSQGAQQDAHRVQALYGNFVSNLLGVQFHRMNPSANPPQLIYNRSSDRTVSYSVVTVNYDLVLESYVEYIKRTYRRGPTENDPDIEFVTNLESPESAAVNPSLTKLHGSVDRETIVPPTWNKVMAEDVIPSWQFAANLLAKANHIRIIGFSLPVADSYIKYLLKAAVIDAPHLKSIDVLCLDWDGSVKRRYDEFIEFYRYRFVSDSVVDYLRHLMEIQITFDATRTHDLAMDRLEQAHEEYFSTNTS